MQALAIPQRSAPVGLARHWSVILTNLCGSWEHHRLTGPVIALPEPIPQALSAADTRSNEGGCCTICSICSLARFTYWLLPARSGP